MKAADQHPPKPGGGGGMWCQRSWALWSAAGPPSPGSDNTPISAHNRYFTPWAPFLVLLGSKPGLDHRHFSLGGSRMHLEMDTAGPEVSPDFWVPENNKWDNTLLWCRWCHYHGLHMGPGKSQSSKALARRVKGEGFAFRVTPRGPGQHCLTLISLAQH